jgi:competence protein ComGC
MITMRSTIPNMTKSKHALKNRKKKKHTKLAIEYAQCFEREKKKVKSLIKMVNKNNQSDRNPNKYEQRNYIIN